MTIRYGFTHGCNIATQGCIYRIAPSLEQVFTIEISNSMCAPYHRAGEARIFLHMLLVFLL